MDTFAYVDPQTGQITHVALVRDADGKTKLVQQDMPSGFSTDKDGAK